MKYSKNYRWGIGFGSFSQKAHELSKVYKPGIRCFKCESDRTFTFSIVGKTRRFMIMFPYGKPMGECC